jgi:hypothetical protein
MYKTLLTMIPMLLALTSLNAQKLPDIQEKSKIAPPAVRIDGKTTEWGDDFEANNKRTNLFYTMANDDQYLYLIVKSTNAMNNSKIIAGGLTLTINQNGKKNDKGSASITYPIVNSAGRGQGRPGNTQGRPSRGEELSRVQRDSMMVANQRQQLAGSKEIKVAELKNVSDTLISIYNEYNVKVGTSVSDDMSLVYELAVPLELLDLDPAKSPEFAYQLKLNGIQFNSPGGSGGFRQRPGGSGPGGNMAEMMSPTDFWGKYKLITK